MPDPISEELLAALRPVFPQFQREGLLMVIEISKRKLNFPACSVGNILPVCIDHLLEWPKQVHAFQNQENNRQAERRNKQNGGAGGKRDENTIFKIPPWTNPSSSESSPNSSSSDSSDLSSSLHNQNHMRFDMERRSTVDSESSTNSASSCSSSFSEGSEPTGIKQKTPDRNQIYNDDVIFIEEKPKKTINVLEDVSTPKSNQNNLNPPLTAQVNNKNEANDVNVFGDTVWENVANTQTVHSTNCNSGDPVNPGTSSAKEPKAETRNIYEIALDQVMTIIPDVDVNFALNLIMQNSGENKELLANYVVEQLFEMPYPKIKQGKIEQAKEQPKQKDPPVIDYFDLNNLQPVPAIYEEQCFFLLQQKFTQLRNKDIRWAMRKNKRHYAATVKFLQDLLARSIKGKSTGMAIYMGPQNPQKYLKFLAKDRCLLPSPQTLHHLLKEEVDFMEASERGKSEAKDHTVALDLNTKQYEEAKEHTVASALNTKQYEEEGQLIECGCCFGEAPFENMVQCIEGHLFCAECLKSYAQEAIFGCGKTQLACMTQGCTSTFPLSQLKKTLPPNIIDKYQERLQDESLKMAELPDLVRCPSCDFAAEMPNNDKVFRCQNEKCKKETCRYCQEEWKDHFGIPCNEMEKKDVKNLRVSYEEKMSMAKIRTCAKCKCGFMKTDGCNKMTCRCGTTMCYICRASKIGYDHFCNHPRDPGAKCKKCKKCCLWTNPTEDEERAIRELRKEAMEESEKLTPSGSDQIVGVKRPLLVGPPENDHYHGKKKKKKRKTM